MTKATAEKMILEFVSKCKGQSVLFNALDEAGREAYVLTKSYNYFRGFLTVSESIDRAMKNTEAHKNGGFRVFRLNPTEHMVIAKE